MGSGLPRCTDPAMELYAAAAGVRIVAVAGRLCGKQREPPLYAERAESDGIRRRGVDGGPAAPPLSDVQHDHGHAERGELDLSRDAVDGQQTDVAWADGAGELHLGEV